MTPVNLPEPWVGGELTEGLPEDPKLLVKALNERFAMLQRNFDTLKSKAVSGPQDLPTGGVTSTLPSNPRDGQVAYYQSSAMATAGAVWGLRYNAASGSTYKWEYVGGAALRDSDAAAQTTSSTSFQTAGTSSVAAPLDGDYDVAFGASFVASQAAALNQMEFALHVNGSALRTLITVTDAAFEANPVSRVERVVNVSAGHAFNPRYRAQNGVSSLFAGMYVAIMPVRVG